MGYVRILIKKIRENKKNKFISRVSITVFSLAALIFTACDRGEINTPMYPDTERVITLTAALPGGKGHGAKTRLTFEEADSEIKTNWQQEHDVLHLFMKNNNDEAEPKEYKTIATIKKVDEANRTAEFEIKLPDTWTEGTMNVYGLLQRSWDLSKEISCVQRNGYTGNLFRMKIADETAFSTEGFSNTALWFKQENIKIGEASNMEINLQHCGYLVVIHIENKTEDEFKFKQIQLTTNFEDFFEEQYVDIDVKTGEYISNNPTDVFDFCNILNLLSRLLAITQRFCIIGCPTTELTPAFQRRFFC